jgi:predicted nucleic acid-binding protein
MVRQQAGQCGWYTRIEDVDAAIAAHAIGSDATLVTGNLGHKARIPGLKIEDWGQ